ncbi:inner membrane protein [alpha proteobacterium U9-1i]|nr:inner membrane protein [alpha proteobacterium U9-1i]
MSLATDRRTDLDWIRIAAFGVLILYHVGMFYVTWDWHVKSGRASDAIEPLMQIVNPWRLLLLFIVSGAATRFMADKMAPGAMARSRLARLLPPLILAIFVIVPPQSYYEIVEAVSHMANPPAGAVDNFYLRYVTASGNWCDPDGCLITPTYNHMWFVAYLIVYTLLAIALLPLLRRAPSALGWLLRGPGLFLVPWLYLFAARVFLRPHFEETHALVDDWYLHAVYFPGFLLGLAIAKHDRFFQAAMRWRWLMLGIAVAAYATLRVAVAMWPNETPDVIMVVERGLREAQAWGAILAVFGFGYRHLRGHDGPIRRTLTEAVFPFYLLHQTIIVVVAYHLDKLGLPLAFEASAVISLTLLGCWLGYALASRLSWLRVWFGLAPKPAAKRSQAIELNASQADLS